MGAYIGVIVEGKLIAPAQLLISQNRRERESG
jgi:hypothetical protein